MTSSSSAGIPAPAGRIEQHPDGYTLTFERRLDFPVDHVWDVLTNRDKVAQWLGIITPAWQIGKEYRLDMGESAVTGTVLQMSPGASLQLTWEDPLGDESVLDWQVHQSADGAVLQFRTHENTADFLTEGAAGWQGILEAFDAVVAGIEPVRTDDPDQWLGLRDAYAEDFDVSPTMGRLDNLRAPAEVVFERWYSAPAGDVGPALERAAARFGIGQGARIDIGEDAGHVRVIIRDPVTGGPDAAAERLAAWHMALDAAGAGLAGHEANPSSRRLVALKDFYRGPADGA
ncbi:SRPBCC domain-containing protein [Arthrobacter sp. zg-Y411]|uniref:SRPBCC domain-containing protein n=1 Tax=Arthrobacter TaxID=1663 RepID=UPI001D1344BE|nr:MULTISPECIES: SRPBCC domain-containing protein [Arthrobacter]MCC3295527.1 SRPBCC domain-containing protein [Arthrobacter zhangbolii]MDN3905043.1 SRPBCC domain-containing protein [Arthrobacter sp. YD2]